MMVNKQTKLIAVDGPAGSGKSSVTQSIAKELGLIHLNSGLLYRVVAYWLYQEDKIAFLYYGPTEGSLDHESLLKNLMQELTKLSSLVEYLPGDSPNLLLNGKSVIQLVTDHHLSALASQVSSILEVRNWVNEILRKLVETYSPSLCIMEGRDVGTYIFPRAGLKFFLTASLDSRANRRWLEQSIQSKKEKKLGKDATLEQIKDDIEKRDLADATRTHAPLKRAEDAIFIDTTKLSFEEVKTLMVSKIKETFTI